MSYDDEGGDADESDASAAESTKVFGGDGEAEDDGEFGDDFDDFEEGGEGDDFGDFDDGFQQGEEGAETTFDEPTNQPSVPAPSLGPVSQRYSILGVLSLEMASLQ